VDEEGAEEKSGKDQQVVISLKANSFLSPWGSGFSFAELVRRSFCDMLYFLPLQN
jgi:hypothetical protein